MKLRNNCILITGGATGIGFALAEQLMALNNTVIICGRSEENLAHAKRQLPGLITYRCDISRADDRHAMQQAMINNGYRVNVLINNAAVATQLDLTDNNPNRLDTINNDLAVNLLAPIALINEWLDSLSEISPRGEREPNSKVNNAAIINVSSPAAVMAIARLPAYSASKAALLSYSRSLRFQLRHTGIRVVDIFPCYVESPMADDFKMDISPMPATVFAQKVIKQLASHREEIWIGNSNIARVCAHLSARWFSKLFNQQLKKSTATERLNRV